VSGSSIFESIGQTEDFSWSFPQAPIFGMIQNVKDKITGSFRAGLGTTNSFQETNIMMIDLTADGLPDIIEETDNGLRVFVNNGLKFLQYAFDQQSPLNLPNVGQSNSIGFTINTSGTISKKITPQGFSFIKGTLSGNLTKNWTVTSLNEQLIDMNGDGYPDFVSALNTGPLQVSYNKLGKANLLKKVENPLKGSFTIDYQRRGNRYGHYPVEITLHTTKADETMLWDMPNSKWVMSQVVVKDGQVLDVNNEDLDGQDQLAYHYRYDGGIYSRREREFLGFTRTEVIEPSFREVGTEEHPEDNYYLSQIAQYYRPLSNDPDYRKRMEYLKDVVTDEYTYENHLAWTQVGEAWVAKWFS
jgi:hypothetical protein